jgi:5-oxoprolinase (ATP-hydrolysing)
VGRLNTYRHLILEHSTGEAQRVASSTAYDPVTLEIFNNLFMSIAEQMGIVLQSTSQSVNVKERLDFSCAIFDQEGNLVANAQHIPVHLGSMDFTVKVLIESDHVVKPGDVFVHNNPYNGGTHLPDITVISPVFNVDESAVLFYVASRAHHEDVGGIAPSSMSPSATTIHEEGVVFDCVKMVGEGVFLTQAMRDKFEEGPYPARNTEQNIADLMAQTAANTTGANELRKLVESYGLETVHAYMGHIQDNAEEAVRRVITSLDDAAFDYEMDTGDRIKLRISVDKEKRAALIDFTGTSDSLRNNLNAPAAITNAAVLYVFRCLVDDDIPLNAGCMKPLTIIVPKGSLLNPAYPAAVAAGNVETSQALVNALFGALEALAASQGTMNNLSFGNDKYQYYETICSGSSAGPGFDGAAAVHTHMTNTRMTDPEIMEHRYPVVLDEFAVVRNSGGKGQWNAGDGIIRRIRFLQDMECSILSGHRVIPPFGLKGGDAGKVGKNWVKRQDGQIEELGGCAQTKVTAGDVINIQSPTGGGYGPKAERADT